MRVRQKKEFDSQWAEATAAEARRRVQNFMMVTDGRETENETKGKDLACFVVLVVAEHPNVDGISTWNGFQTYTSSLAPSPRPVR